jgi:hypothetical protein
MPSTTTALSHLEKPHYLGNRLRDATTGFGAKGTDASYSQDQCTVSMWSAIPRSLTHMEAHVQPGALGRSADEVGAAHAIALVMFRHEQDESMAKPWLQGMVATSVWILGFADQAPLTEHVGPADRAALDREMLAAATADLPGQGDARSRERMYARGVYRMATYALGLRDEMPVQLTTPAAEAVLAESRRAA